MPLFRLFQSAPQAFSYLPYGPWPTLEDFLMTEERLIRGDPAVMHWAVLDLTKPAPEEAPWGEGQLAGYIAILNTAPARLSTEIGHVLIHPSFQRTHVTTNAVGLLLHWCFDTLKLRRVQWFANVKNESSIRVAKRLGFAFEGSHRWHMVLPPHKEDVGIMVERDGKPEAPGRHSAQLAIGWDQWEDGLRAQVQNEMDRRA
jgi:RimJ/RimL family protein N-acetyltransferase